MKKIFIFVLFSIILITGACGNFTKEYGHKKSVESSKDNNEESSSIAFGSPSVFEQDYSIIADRIFEEMYDLAQSNDFNKFITLFDDSYTQDQLESAFELMGNYSRDQRKEKHITKIRTSSDICFIADILEYTVLVSEDNGTSSSTQNISFGCSKSKNKWLVSESKEVVNIQEKWIQKNHPIYNKIKDGRCYFNGNFMVIYKFPMPDTVDTYLDELYYEGNVLKASFLITNGNDNDIFNITYDRFQVFDGHDTLIFDLSGYELDNTILVKSNDYYSFKLTIPEEYIKIDNIDFTSARCSSSVNYDNRKK